MTSHKERAGARKATITQVITGTYLSCGCYATLKVTINSMTCQSLINKNKKSSLANCYGIRVAHWDALLYGNISRLAGHTPHDPIVNYFLITVCPQACYFSLKYFKISSEQIKPRSIQPVFRGADLGRFGEDAHEGVCKSPG